MSVEIKYLSKLRDDKTFVYIYTDSYSEADYGFIIDFNEEFLVLKKFNEESLFDGISILRRDNITRINWGGNDIENTFKLIFKKEYESEVKNINLESIETIIKSAFDNFNHLTVRIQDIDNSVYIIGQLEDIDDETIVVNAFGTKSTLDRSFLMVSLENITRVDAGGIYERNLQILFDKKAQS
jgi:hypothetical protein